MAKHKNSISTGHPTNHNLDWLSASGPIDYTLTNDYMFRIILQDNADVLKGLISSLMQIPLEQIKTVTIENPIQPGEAFDNKSFVLDLKILLNDNSGIA